jgi:eukaryotic-like serine/threonine-protein kinase
MSPNRPTDDFDETELTPTQIGRYRIEKMLGGGGFGNVYLAFDSELERQVAIKVPHRRLVKGSNGAAEYLKEARMVANLDHPNIVPVYDVGSSDEIDCYVVSKYIPGSDLGIVLRDRRLSILESTVLTATIADALHHAHKRGIVHRDVKPSNILIDSNGKPYLADFGLALPEKSLGTGPRYAGTPAYMSPEQARGEGHRVDGRSDIFSLGAVLYELLTGKRAFRGETKADLFELVENFDPKPLRQYDENIPKELDRICQKTMAKRASERYSTAHDLAEDLRSFLNALDPDERTSHARSSLTMPNTHQRSPAGGLEQTVPNLSDRGLPTPISASVEAASVGVAIVPKGLRSFDAHDADFFLELLPGPQGRDGLPENLRFWKDQIEEMDAEKSFTVGLIYGPSGCGKSSFVKAGLMPRLASHIIPLFIESSGEFTEKRLLQAIHKICPSIDPALGVSEAIATIRRGGGIAAGQKVLFVFDQFEQWLHAHRGEETHELFKALRQCDGERVQAILLVRSDFWMAVMWFLNDLEVELVQGKNFAAIDLFPPRHAEKVLIAFGRAFGTLPAEGKMSSDQLAFIRQSIDGLTQDGKVMCVRLAVYAEMMKNKAWTPASLRKIGGTEGVGVSFLDDSFGPQANPRIRIHQNAARAVLQSLLPDSETIINIQLRSYDQLFQASGYTDPKQFDDLLRVLDGEMRLISPTDPLGMTQDSKSSSKDEIAIDPSKKYYRLSHDYLVTALRQWLSRKQRETRKGRAELLLAERASFWASKRESRYLPSFVEHARIRLLTSPKLWDKIQTEMMTATAKNHFAWIGGTGVSLVLLVVAAWGLQTTANAEKQRIMNERKQAQFAAEGSRLVDALLNAETIRVSDITSELKNYGAWAKPKLRTAFINAAEGSNEKLHSAMALVEDSKECQDYLASQIPLVQADRFATVCNTLRSVTKDLPAAFVEIANDPSRPSRARLQAACAIAQFDATHEFWQDKTTCNFVVDQLMLLYPSELAPLRQALKPVAAFVMPRLQEIFLDRTLNRQARLFATESLVEYKKESAPEVFAQELFGLLLDCDETQYPMVFHALRGYEKFVSEQAINVLILAALPDATESDKDVLAEHQANAAVALYELSDFDSIWPEFKSTEDPRITGFLIHWLANRNVSHAALLKRIKTESDPLQLQSLLLASGEFATASFSKEEYDSLASQCESILRTAKTSNLRAAAIWLLRAIGKNDVVEEVINAQKNEWNQLNVLRLAKLEPIRKRFDELKSAATEKQATLRSQRLDAIRSADLPAELTGAFFAPLNSVEEILPSDPSKPSEIATESGLFGDAFHFEGRSTAKLKQGNGGPNSKSFSFGCWFKTDNNSQFSALFSRQNSDQELEGFDLWMEKGKLCSHVKQRYVEPDHKDNHYAKTCAEAFVADNKWHHAMVVYDASRQANGTQIYIDGKACETVLLANSLQGDVEVSGELIIGGRHAGFEFSGSLCNVRVINHILDSNMVQQLFWAELRSVASLDETTRNETQRQVLDDYLNVPDPDQNINESNWVALENQRVAESKSSEFDWRYSSQGHWMIRLDAKKFQMGSPVSEQGRTSTEDLHTRTIDRLLELSAHEVTVGQWRAFHEKVPISDSLKGKYTDLATADPDTAIVNITWFEAVQYCNWLSEQDGIPPSQWCYTPHPENGYSIGMLAKPRHWELTGYRLPTESEWEYACRAGSNASRCYGTSDSLLSKYAWYQLNSADRAHPVGLLKPNALGFFDMYGNASEWCFDLHTDYPYAANEARDDKFSTLLTADRRVLKGGGYYDLSKYVRSAHRYTFDPTHELAVTGFRIARTLETKNEN